MLEREIEQKLKKTIEAKGGLALKFVSPGISGVPDRLVLIPSGRITFVELKAPGKKLSPKQVKIAKRLESLGHKVWMIDSIKKISEFIQEVFPDEICSP